MRTNRSETRSMTVNAPPETVLEFLADAQTLPRWAPGFARAVRPENGHWVVDTGEGELAIELRVSRALGTVDILRPGDQRRGVFMRVVPNGDGCECTFTQVFPHGTPEETIARQIAVIDGELGRVREHCEKVLPAAMSFTQAPGPSR